jgi:hypothetical protein
MSLHGNDALQKQKQNIQQAQGMASYRLVPADYEEFLWNRSQPFFFLSVRLPLNLSLMLPRGVGLYTSF